MKWPFNKTDDWMNDEFDREDEFRGLSNTDMEDLAELRIDRLHPEILKEDMKIPDMSKFPDDILKHFSMMSNPNIRSNCKSKVLIKMHNYIATIKSTAQKELDRRMYGDIDEDDVEMMLAEARMIINGKM